MVKSYTLRRTGRVAFVVDEPTQSGFALVEGCGEIADDPGEFARLVGG